MTDELQLASTFTRAAQAIRLDDTGLPCDDDQRLEAEVLSDLAETVVRVFGGGTKGNGRTPAELALWRAADTWLCLLASGRNYAVPYGAAPAERPRPGAPMGRRWLEAVTALVDPLPMARNRGRETERQWRQRLQIKERGRVDGDRTRWYDELTSAERAALPVVDMPR